MSRYVLTPEAQADMREIRDYLLREGGFKVARYVLGAIVVACRGLDRSPGQGHRREDLTDVHAVRFWAVFSYLIVYRMDRKPLTVIAILHGKRDVKPVIERR